ncbi:Transcription factor tau subunit sfc1 [Hondaea fermentalgiana]|uniref:Transcription factor tau subunit sfc1 n=1 Tax=Hondaea fermentalgiana TaxID=2315210 RepID=A0A2R5G9U2_9STRA|nr:Transcription factor tau subunit sfc1 [Hondaea fermentalgiana]|eukprot:GBG27822.1 Transcription factor tau subunit sfc1 [Hondaea fermentalgiana]
MNYPSEKQRDREPEKRGGEELKAGHVATQKRARDLLAIELPFLVRETKDAGIAIKIRRKRKSQKVTKAEIVGFAEDCHGFTSLCDFAYRPGVLDGGWDASNRGLLTTLEEEIPEAIQGVRRSRVRTRTEALQARNSMYLPVPIFATSQPPQSLDFSDTKISGALAASLGGPDATTEIPCVDIDVASVPVPQEIAPPTLSKSEAEARSAQVALRAKLRTAMNRKPVWTRHALMTHLGCSQSLLARTAWTEIYQSAKGGAFGGHAFLRRGFDPRLSRHFAQYQPLRFRITKSLVTRLQTQAKRLGLPNLGWLGPNAKTYPTVLVGDVRDKEFQRMARARVTSHYKARHGWFTEESRQLLSRRFEVVVGNLLEMLEAIPSDYPRGSGDEVDVLLGLSDSGAVSDSVWAGSEFAGADHREASLAKPTRRRGSTQPRVSQPAPQIDLLGQAPLVLHEQGAPPLPPPVEDAVNARFNIEHRGSLDGAAPPRIDRPSVAPGLSYTILGDDDGQDGAGNGAKDDVALGGNTLDLDEDDDDDDSDF